MAARYWVGGSGTWDTSSTANWAATSGGASGASAPISTDTVTFDTNSGTAATVSVAATATCATCAINKADINLNLTGSPTFTGALTLTTGTITLYPHDTAFKIADQFINERKKSGSNIQDE